MASELAIRITAQDSASGVLGTLQGALGGLAGAFTAPMKGILSLGQGIGMLGVAVGGLSTLASTVGSVASSMVSGNAEFERYETQFGVLLKSSDAAKQRLSELAEFGAKTPFELPELVRADKVLTAFGLHSETTAAKFGVSGDQILKTIGDVASGTGTSFEELSVTFGKFASGSTGDAIARFQELGIATKEEMASWGLQFSKTGELLTPANEAFGILEKNVRAKFGGMMDAQSNTFEGMVSNLQDWMGQTKRTLMAPVFEVLKDKLAGVLQLLNSPQAKAALDSIGQTLAKGVAWAVDAVGWLSDKVGKLIGYLSPDNKTDVMREWFGDAGPIIDNVVRGVKDIVGAITGLVQTGDARGFVGKIFGPDALVTFDRVSYLVGMITTGLGRLGAGLGEAFGMLMKGDLGGAINKLIGSEGQWLGVLGNVGQTILGWIVELWPGVQAQLTVWLGQLWAWVQAQAPVIAAQLQAWGQAFIAWIGPMIPPFLAQLGALATQLWGWIQAQFPVLVDQFSSWASALGAWLVPAATEFLTKWPTMLDGILNTIGEAAGPILEAVGNWLVDAGVWLLKNLPNILIALAGIVGAIVLFIAETGLVLGEKILLHWIPALISWVAKAIEKLLPALGDLLLALGTWFVNTAAPEIGRQGLKLGTQLVTSLIDGLKDLGTRLMATISDAVRSIKIDIGPFHLSAAGFRIDAPDIGKAVTTALGGNAAGTEYWRGGPTWVGERGPEIVNLPQGSQVISNDRASAGNTITINVTTTGDPASTANAVSNAIRSMGLA